MKIKHVFQIDNSGCGIACISMIVNQTYAQVKEKMLEIGIFKEGNDYYGTNFKDISKSLDIFGLAHSPKRKFKKWQNIPAKLAIASTNYDKLGVWHWVVFVRDINGYFIYDPGKRRKKIRCLRGKMSGWFIEIL